MTSAVPYKLLPLSVYQELTADGNCGESNTSADIQNNHQQSQVELNGRNHEKGAQRSVGEIQKNYVKAITESRSTPPQVNSGGSQATNSGHGIKTPSVSWLHTDPTSLPRFSQQTRLQQSFKNYSDLLESKDIPLHLKIPLLEYYNQRYVNSKNEKQGPSEVSSGEESDNDNTATHYKFQSEQGVSSTLPQIKQAKRIYAQQILTQLSKYHKHIRWDSQGEITKPVLGKNNSVNDLKSLLEIIIYRNKGNLSHFGEVSKILLPIFSKVREFIQNKKLLTYMENTSQSVITQGTRKTKRPKNNNYQALY